MFINLNAQTYFYGQDGSVGNELVQQHLFRVLEVPQQVVQVVIIMQLQVLWGRVVMVVVEFLVLVLLVAVAVAAVTTVAVEEVLPILRAVVLVAVLALLLQKLLQLTLPTRVVLIPMDRLIL